MEIAARQNAKWEDRFVEWSQPPGETERKRCDDTVGQICEAVKASTLLSKLDIATFAQGSYANRINVRQDSDVDVCCLHKHVFYYVIPEGFRPSQLGIGQPNSLTYAEFKQELGRALRARFGSANVMRNDKSFDIHETTRRVDADAVATFAYRQYFISNDDFAFHEGTALVCDSNQLLATNFPEQQYANGIAKNNATNRRFKKQVRIQKTLRNALLDAQHPAAEPITSMMIEGWVWSAPNHCFAHRTLFADFEAVLRWVYENPLLLVQSNGIKPLSDRPDSLQAIINFVEAAWSVTH